MLKLKLIRYNRIENVGYTEKKIETINHIVSEYSKLAKKRMQVLARQGRQEGSLGITQ